MQEIVTIQSPVIFDSKNLMSQNPFWIVKFGNNDANIAAHCLAKIALSCNSESVWMEDSPTNINSVFMRDMRYNLVS